MFPYRVVGGKTLYVKKFFFTTESILKREASPLVFQNLLYDISFPPSYWTTNVQEMPRFRRISGITVPMNNWPQIILVKFAGWKDFPSIVTRGRPSIIEFRRETVSKHGTTRDILVVRRTLQGGTTYIHARAHCRWHLGVMKRAFADTGYLLL